MKLVAGLGNPGPRYQLSRHNVGFMVLDNLALAFQIRWGKRKFQARLGQGMIADQQVLLVKPQTFMNSSGRALAQLVYDFSVPLAELIVIHDDLDLALGKIQIKKGGGDGGHQGLRSIIDWLEDASFLRLRLGIGRPRPGQEPAEYVLSPFDEEEMDDLNQMVAKAEKALTCLLTEGEVRAMNKFNA